MAVRQNQPGSAPRRALRRFFLSAFVVVSFVAYALHKPSNAAQGSLTPGSAGPTTVSGQPTTPASDAPTAAAAPPQQNNPTNIPAPSNTSSLPAQPPTPTTPPPTNTPAVASGQYKDGTYTGPQVDAFYGIVQVQAVIQNGKIATVQFLQYPNDRMTSVRINNVAVPYLQQEALQAQSANVDLISGATLTSEGFVQSLQPALDQAKR